MPRMLNLANILELVDDALDDSSTTQQQSVEITHQPGLHALATLGHQFDALSKERVKQLLTDIALVPKNFAEHSPKQVCHRLSVIHVPPSKAEVEKLSLVVEHQVQFETVEPTSRCFSSLGDALKDFVLANSGVVADRHLGGVDKRDSRAASPQRGQVVKKQDEDTWDVLDESLVANEVWELGFPMHLDEPCIKGLEVSESAEVKGNEEGDNFALAEASWSVAPTLPDLTFSHFGESDKAKVIDFAEESE